MSISTARETLDDLYLVDGKAELVDGRIIRFMPTGSLPSRVAFKIALHLHEFATANGGEVYTDGVGYAVPELPSGRESFSPDASYHRGPFPADPMRFIPSAPTFAVEVRSECDYRPGAEDEMAAKRADYFLAGTTVVWDVDPLAKTIAVYQADEPDRPIVYSSGQMANAEPAMIGWSVAVDEIFGQYI